jgi:hypothetical protein
MTADVDQGRGVSHPRDSTAPFVHTAERSHGGVVVTDVGEWTAYDARVLDAARAPGVVTTGVACIVAAWSEHDRSGG